MSNNIFDIGEHRYLARTFCCRSFVFDREKPIVVTFHYAQNIPTLDSFSKGQDNIFSYEFLKSNKVNVLSIAPLEENSWYRDAALFCFLKSISRAISSFPVRVGYGSSMGGYGAATFAGVLGLNRLLLLNPISTLDCNKAPFERRFKSIQHDWEGEYSDASEVKQEGCLIYDPLCREDRLHAQRFKENIRLIPLIGAGHNTPKLLLDMGVLKELVLTYIDKGEVNIDLKKRRNCVFYYKNLLNSRWLTESRARIINAYLNFFVHKNELRYIASFSNKELYDMEQSAIKLAEDNEYKLALAIMKHMLKLKPTSKRYQSLHSIWLSSHITAKSESF